MGKAKGDDNTPEQPTAIGRWMLTPEQRAAFQRMMEEAARLDKAAKAIDRAIAIQGGLVPPPWAEKLLKPAIEPKHEAPSRKKEGWQERRVKPMLCKLWPPNGIPPASLPPKDIVKQFDDEYQKQHGRKSAIHRNTILRHAGRLPR